jgi:hypothetical protein
MGRRIGVFVDIVSVARMTFSTNTPLSKHPFHPYREAAIDLKVAVKRCVANSGPAPNPETSVGLTPSLNCKPDVMDVNDVCISSAPGEATTVLALCPTTVEITRQKHHRR